MISKINKSIAHLGTGTVFIASDKHIATGKKLDFWVGDHRGEVGDPNFLDFEIVVAMGARVTRSMAQDGLRRILHRLENSKAE
jgi:hypothetical protein